MQVGGVADVVLCVDGIGILPLGDLGLVGRQIRLCLIRITRHIGVAGDVVDILPDVRILLNLGGRNPAQELIARHGHVGIGRRGFECQTRIDVTILSVVGPCINRPILIEMRIAIQKRRIFTFRRFLLKQVAFIASSSSLLYVAILVIEVDVRGHHGADIILLRR